MDDPYKKPVFEVLRQDDGLPENWHRFQVYADGRIEGFGDAKVVINYIPTLFHRVK